MSANLSVLTAIQEGENLLGIRVSINAALVIRGAEAYLVDSIEEPESLEKIPVHCPNLESRLDVAIGGWMGSAYSYIDPVLISGILEAGTVRRYKLVLSHVDELTVFRGGEVMQILPVR